MPLANPGLMSHVTGETLSGSPLRSMKSRANSLTVFESSPGTTQVYFVKLRWTCSVVPEKLRTLDRGRPWRDSQFASTRLSPSRDMSR